MKKKDLKLPAILLAIGLILTVAAYFLTSIRQKPTVTEQDFAYSVTYQVNGETKTLEGIYSCRFNGYGSDGIDPLIRYYAEEYTVDGVTDPSKQDTVAEKDGYTLDLVILFNALYLMGDPQCDPYYEVQAPHFEASDAEGNPYSEEELPAVFDAKIVSWEYPEPIQNSFVFAGFGGLYTVSMGAMLLAGLLTLILCMILVRKGEGVVYRTLDSVGVFLNFATALVVLPFISFVICLAQAYKVGPDWVYQMYLCVPPMIALSLAASVALRRKGYRLSGFFIQFLGIAFLLIPSVLEYALIGM